MWRGRMLKVVLVLVGLLFTAGVYPLIGSLLHPADSDTGDTMMLSLYVALGILLLISVRNPSAHRSLIAFAAWSSFAHAVTNVDTGTRNRQRAVRISGRVGCACCRRRGPDSVGSGQEVSRAAIGTGDTGIFSNRLNQTISPTITDTRVVGEIAVLHQLKAVFQGGQQ